MGLATPWGRWQLDRTVLRAAREISAQLQDGKSLETLLCAMEDKKNRRKSKFSGFGANKAMKVPKNKIW